MTLAGGFIIIFAFLFGVPLLLLLARLVGWITGAKAKPIWLVLLFVIALPIAFTLYLDLGGVLKLVKIVQKREEVKINFNGNWTRTRGLSVEYEVPGETLPTQLSIGCDGPTYDNLQVGQTVEARLLDLGGVFKFARLKSRSTFSMLAGLFPRQPNGPWREGLATVTEVKHITKFSGRSSKYEYRWPYDVVELSFVPDGRTQAVAAVDNIEAASMPKLTDGQTVRITWPLDDPRAARIADARPGAPWANFFYVFAETIVIAAAFIGGIILVSFIFRRRKKQRKSHPVI